MNIPIARRPYYVMTTDMDWFVQERMKDGLGIRLILVKKSKQDFKIINRKIIGRKRRKYQGKF